MASFGMTVGGPDAGGASLSGFLDPTLLWLPPFSLDTCPQAPLRIRASTHLGILFLRPVWMPSLLPA